MDDYYSRHEVSNSDLSALKRALSGDDRDPTEAYKFGRIVDLVITEPGKVNHYTRRAGDDMYSEEEMERALEMKKAFLRDDTCKKLLEASCTQVVMVDPCKTFDYTPAFSLPVRCKWDFWTGTWGGDLKSTTATTSRQFEEAARFFDHDRQRYFYMNISGSDRDILIGVSKVNFKVFKIFIRRGDDFFNQGKEKCLELAYRYWLMFGNINTIKSW